MAFAEDLDEFLDPDEFADQAVFTLADDSTIGPVNGIYDDPFLDAKVGEYAPGTSAPRFCCKAADVPGVKRRDAAVVTTATGSHGLVVLDVEPDGTGMVVVQLARE